MAEGFLLIDKPTGWTSHDVVAKTRGILGERRIGHAGTLDPMATGLLVLGVGRATRLIRFIQAGTKRYVARVVFGVATDTLDADGAILDREPMDFTVDDLTAVTQRFVGTIAQVPPMVSAVKIGGKRLYELAREGIEVERAPRSVDIHSIDVLDFAPGPYPEADIEVVCGAGTYIRTLADDVAQALGGRAHLGSLRRIAIGPHSVERAFTVERLSELPDPAEALVTMADALGDLDAVVVGPDVAAGVSNGVVYGAPALGATTPGLHRILADDGRLLAVYASDGRWAKPEVVVA